MIGDLTTKSHGVSSGPIEILDSKTIKIPMFSYNGAGKGNYTYLIFHISFILIFI